MGFPDNPACVRETRIFLFSPSAGRDCLSADQHCPASRAQAGLSGSPNGTLCHSPDAASLRFAAPEPPSRRRPRTWTYLAVDHWRSALAAKLEAPHVGAPGAAAVGGRAGAGRSRGRGRGCLWVSVVWFCCLHVIAVCGSFLWW